jgi:putative transposase
MSVGPAKQREQARSKVPWPHAPLHRLDEAGVYIVTAGTYQKEHLFSDGPRLRMLHAALLTIADKHGVRLEAWAVFPNHYRRLARTDSHARPGQNDLFVQDRSSTGHR